jgi:hypothetical protein
MTATVWASIAQTGDISMATSVLPDNSNTIDLIVDEALDLRRYKRAMYGLRDVTFTHVGREYAGKVLSVQPHVEPGPPAWLVRMLARPHVARPLKRAELRWIRRENGEIVVC